MFKWLVNIFNPVLLQRKLEKQAGIKKNLYLVEVEGVFRNRFVVKCSEKRILAVEVDELDDMIELGQNYVGGKIVGCRKLENEEEFLQHFDADNDYCSDWNKEDKLSFINEVNEE